MLRAKTWIFSILPMLLPRPYQAEILEGLQSLAFHGYQTQDWYEAVEGDLMDCVLRNAVG